jgi:hypothetical protein
MDMLIFLRPFVWSCVSGLMQFLTADQKQQLVKIFKELCTVASEDTTFLSRFITGDESWIYGYDRDKATILPMEKSKLTETKKGETGEEQSQEHAHHFV